jgi:hypothetical protein
MGKAIADKHAPIIQSEEDQMIGHLASIKRILDKEKPEYKS